MYRWLRMPFEISTAPEKFQRRIEEALEGLNGIKPIHDGKLIYGCGYNDNESLMIMITSWKPCSRDVLREK